MVVYTWDAMCAEAGLDYGCEITDENKAPIEARIELAIEETNAAYAMSGMFAGTVRLVHMYLNAEYEEVPQDGDFEASNSYQQMLNDVSTPGDGKLEEVFGLRDEYGADIVDLWVDVGGYCGMAWGSCTNQFCDCEYPYAVIQRSCATGYWTFGHENGHCQGNQHDRANDSSIRKFAYGWQDPEERFRTIMAYDCDDQTCGKVQRFSTPDVTWYGDPIGDADNDNVRQMALSWKTLATCRPVATTDESPDESPDEEDYVMQIFSGLEPTLCMVARGESRKSSVKLGQDCMSFRMDEDSLIRAFKEGGDLCLQAGSGKSIEDGNKVRFYPCDSSNVYQQFSWVENDPANPIYLKSDPDFCMTSRGVKAQKGDRIIVKVCDDIRPVERPNWFGD